MKTSKDVTSRVLTFSEQQAAEAAFRGLPFDPQWPLQAQAIYEGILAVTKGRDVCTSPSQSETEDAELEYVLM